MKRESSNDHHLGSPIKMEQEQKYNMDFETQKNDQSSMQYQYQWTELSKLD